MLRIQLFIKKHCTWSASFFCVLLFAVERGSTLRVVSAALFLIVIQKSDSMLVSKLVISAGESLHNCRLLDLQQWVQRAPEQKVSLDEEILDHRRDQMARASPFIFALPVNLF